MNLVDQLKRDEGIELKPYKDSVGKLTIGIGRNLDDTGISGAEAEFMLENDITRTHLALTKALPWTADLDETRLGVLLNMGFNMGIGGLLGFRTFLSELKASHYAEAAIAMLDSKWATQAGNRAQRLALQIESGQWQ